jgi:hypothetical protein
MPPPLVSARNSHEGASSGSEWMTYQCVACGTKCSLTFLPGLPAIRCLSLSSVSVVRQRFVDPWESRVGIARAFKDIAPSLTANELMTGMYFDRVSSVFVSTPWAKFRILVQ